MSPAQSPVGPAAHAQQTTSQLLLHSMHAQSWVKQSDIMCVKSVSLSDLH